MMREKWVPIIAVAVLGTLGYIYWKDKQNATANTGGQASTINTLSPQPLPISSVGSYVDPNGGLNYVDAVPVSITSSTGFTAQDYNYGVVNERPIASANGWDLVPNPAGTTGSVLVPTGPGSLASYHSVVG